MKASRRILLRNKHNAAPTSRGEPTQDRISGSRHGAVCSQKLDIGARSRTWSRCLYILAKMPLHSGKDKMALVLLTLKHMENLETNEAIVNYEEGLGGGPLGRVS